MRSIKKEKPIRRYSGEKWKTNTINKKYLAEDFKHRCAYCDDLDRLNGEYRAYHVEHFAPKDKFPRLKYNYSNLLYACPYCNNSKSNKWPSTDSSINVIGDQGFLDPCKSEYYKHLHRNDNGSIGYDTNLGKYIFEELNLGLKRHQVNYRLAELDDSLVLLQEKIKKMKSVGEDTSRLEKICGDAALEYWRVSRSR